MVRVCHRITAGFDDPNLVSAAGLVPVMALAQAAGLGAPAEPTASGPPGCSPSAHAAYYSQAVIAAARTARARFSLTARMDPAVAAAITRIPETAWVPIKYPKAIWEETEQRWISEAEVAETTYTAFTSRRTSQHVTARLIVRRVTRLNPTTVPAGQGEMFTRYRHHAVFTNSPLSMLAAEACHRDHAVIEQVIADLKNGPLAHAPSGKFGANGAWTFLAAIAFNLTRAAGILASRRHARARPATIRTQLINVPARIANRARRLHLHLPGLLARRQRERFLPS